MHNERNSFCTNHKHCDGMSGATPLVIVHINAASKQLMGRDLTTNGRMYPTKDIQFSVLFIARE
jgi:hypothetical protein